MLTKAAIRYLNVQPAMDVQVSIQEPYTYESNLMRNRLWYRGEPYELDQFFKQISSDPVNKSRFWSAVPSNDLSIRKLHSGLPAIIVDRLTDIVIADLDGISLEKDLDSRIWEEISIDNKFNSIVQEAISETLIAGDGAFKISIDANVSQYPIIEFYKADNVEYVLNRGRLQEIKYSNLYEQGQKNYKLIETYGKGYVKYNLYDEYGKELPVTIIEATKDLEDVEFDGDFKWAYL
jgi:hypothetical protein